MSPSGVLITIFVRYLKSQINKLPHLFNLGSKGTRKSRQPVVAGLLSLKRALIILESSETDPAVLIDKYRV